MERKSERKKEKRKENGAVICRRDSFSFSVRLLSTPPPPPPPPLLVMSCNH